ncbi:MAG: epoxyqueuosine reductase [Anaerolineae bacterium]|nr:epoxyqueuosine reductase [Anaerolineae bacterium]
MKTWIEQEITGFVKQAALRTQTAWGKPLVAFASAHDELFARLKTLIGPTHATPGELLDDAQTIIVYFLPFDRSIVHSNRPGDKASHEWAMAYIETNHLITAINRHLAHALAERCYKTVVLPPTHNFDREKLISDWSHKHVAYIAGLGRFGLHHMLITGEGCCGRLGSLVTTAPTEATPRPVEEYCLYKHNQTCQACVKRCVGAALTANGLDRHRCYAICLENAELHKEQGLADVCGKCVSMVPCSFENPVARLSQ